MLEAAGDLFLYLHFSRSDVDAMVLNLMSTLCAESQCEIITNRSFIAGATIVIRTAPVQTFV